LITQLTTNQYNAANQLILFDSIPNQYDANGNLVQEGNAGTYTWDGRNRLKSIVTTSGQTTNFTYDFSGNLIQQSDSGLGVNLNQTIILDKLTNVAYVSRSDGDSYSVLAGLSIDDHLAVVHIGGQIEYGLMDAVNSTVATVDQTGAQKGRFTYEPFGQTTTTNSNYPFQFTGRVPVSSTLYYYRARFYNSQTGRFISEDPAGFAGGPNLYGYVGNNPIGFTDPLGLGTFCIINQQTGFITCEDDNTGQPVVTGTGYSGNGPGLNNPAMQSVPFVGPTPTGLYALGPGSPGDLGLAFPLTPQQPIAGNRNRLYIHADNADQNFSASDGCFILGRTPNQRQAIQRTGTGYVYVY
jgi:RHS repeat-associated protein